MIVYNGASGGLGRFLAPALTRQGLGGHALSVRLEDRAGLREELAGLRPQSDPVLILMAARVSVPACEADPDGAHEVNVTHSVDTAREFVTWARQQSLTPSVVHVSTGHVYAEQPVGTRLVESAPTNPRSVYARTKLEAEEALGLLAEEMEFRLSVARVFGLMAPGQPASYVLPGLIERVRSRRLGEVPGLDFVRDYLDARDVCHSLLLLAAASASGPGERLVLNVCSGEGVAIREVLRAIVSQHSPDEEAELMSQASAAPGRPDDIAWIVGDTSAFTALTGARSRTIPLARTVSDALASG